MIETMVLYADTRVLTTLLILNNLIEEYRKLSFSVEVYDKLSYSILAQSIRIVAIKDNMRHVIYYNGTHLVMYAPEKESNELD